MSDPEQCIYELKSIVIHRGGPYGGHYHAYIRDDLEDGNWNIEIPEKYQSEPIEVKQEVKKEEPETIKEEVKVQSNKKQNKKNKQKQKKEEKKL